MSEFKGTAGPWVVKHSTISWWIEAPKDMSRFASGAIPCHYWHQERHEIDNCEALNNARLIAAAPDLLEALEGVACTIRSVGEEDDYPEVFAAIAKALQP